MLQKIFQKLLILIVFTLTISSPLAVIGQQRDTVNLEEVEIRGIKPEISGTTSNPVQQLTIKKLNALPATSVADAIRNFSGVTVKDFGGIGGLKTVMIRSLGANHTAVFVDGLPATDAATGQIDLGRITLQDVGNIQLSIGQPEFGVTTARMYASAGVLDIRSKETDFDKRKTILDLGIRAGSWGTLNPSLGISHKWSKKTSSSIRYNYYSANGKFPYEIHNGAQVSALTRQNSDVATSDLLLRTKVTFNDSSTLSVKATWYHSERGLPGAVIYYNPYSVQRLTNNDVLTGIQYKTQPGTKYQMLASGGFSFNHLLYSDPNFQNQSGGIKNKYDQQEFYLSDAVSYKFSPNFTALLATDLIINSLKTNAYSIENPQRLTSLTVAALRYMTRNSELKGSILMTAVKDELDNEGHKNFSKLSPSLSFLTAITRDHALKARISFNKSMRMPSFNDLYYTISGNVNVKPEDASMFDAGLLFSKAFNNSVGLNFRLDAFYNLVTDKIVVLPTQNLFIWSTRNIGKVDARGIELGADFVKHSGDWSYSLSANYTYQEAIDITDKKDETYGNQVAYIPYETGGAIATVYFRNISAGINFLYNGFKYTSGYNLPSNVIDQWTTTDITLSWEKIIRGHSFKIKAETLNLFDQQYEVVRGFPMTGQSFYINLYLTI